jgi:hypothetical protein
MTTINKELSDNIDSYPHYTNQSHETNTMTDKVYDHIRGTPRYTNNKGKSTSPMTKTNKPYRVQKVHKVRGPTEGHYRT